MDLMLLGQPGGVSAAGVIRTLLPDVRVIALSSFSSLDLVTAAFEAGVTSYLLKNVSIDELADAIRRTFAGEAVISPEVAQMLRGAPAASSDA